MDVLEDILKRYPNDRIIQELVKKSRPMDMQDLYNGYQKTRPNTNITNSPDLYLTRDSQVREFPQDLTAAGLVFGDAPNTAFIGKNYRTDDTIPHELSHVQQRKSKQLFSDRYRNPVRDLGTDKKGINHDQWMNMMIQARISKDKRLPINASDVPTELSAAFQGLEALEPAGTNILDTPLGKSVVRTPQERRVMEHAMYPTQNKAFVSNYEFKDKGTPGEGLLTLLRRYIRNGTAY